MKLQNSVRKNKTLLLDIIMLLFCSSSIEQLFITQSLYVTILFQLNRATVHNPITGELEFAHYRISKKYISRQKSVKLATKRFLLKHYCSKNLRERTQYFKNLVAEINHFNTQKCRIRICLTKHDDAGS